jgi:hypothetical protein
MKSTLVLHRPLFPKFRILNVIVGDPSGRASKAYVFSPLIAGIEGANPADGVGVRLLCLLCIV